MAMRTPFVAVVAEDFEGEVGELSMKEGTKCIVLLCEDDGWWTVMSKQETGIFPGSYLEGVMEISLPFHAKVVKKYAGGPPVGQVILVEEVSAEGWMVRDGLIPSVSSWAHLEITSDPLSSSTTFPEPENTEAPSGGSQVEADKEVKVHDKGAKQLSFKDEPTAEQVQPTTRNVSKTTSSIPKEALVKVQTPEDPTRKRVKMQQKTPQTGHKPSIMNQQRGAVGTSTPLNQEPETFNMKRKRIVSMFGDFSVNSDFDVVFDDQEDGTPFDPYAMPIKEHREYLQMVLLTFSALTYPLLVPSQMRARRALGVSLSSGYSPLPSFSGRRKGLSNSTALIH